MQVSLKLASAPLQSSAALLHLLPPPRYVRPVCCHVSIYVTMTRPSKSISRQTPCFPSHSKSRLLTPERGAPRNSSTGWLESAGQHLWRGSRVLLWRSQQDCPREAGLRGFNDQQHGGGPDRSAGSNSALFGPPASQGSGPSQPETDPEGLHWTVELFYYCPHKHRAWLRTRKSQETLFRNSLREVWLGGPATGRKLKEKQRFVPW